MISHPAAHLTHNYRRDEESNNWKLLDLDHREHMEIYETLRLIEAWRDMDAAEGHTLDKIGKNVLVLREGRDDESFRKAIKIKIRGNLSAGTVEDFNAIGEILFGNNFTSLSEAWHQAEYNHEPAAVIMDFTMTEFDANFFSYLAYMSDVVRAAGVAIRFVVQTEAAKTTDYHASAISGFMETYIADNPEMGGETIDYHGAGVHLTGHDIVIIDNPTLGGKTVDYKLAAANVFAEVLILENTRMGGTAETIAASSAKIFRERGYQSEFF